MAIHHLKETKKINLSTSYDYDLVDNSTLMNTIELDNKSALLASDIDRNDILEAIDRLPEHHKSVFNMYVMDNFSHNEIAKTLAISVGFNVFRHRVYLCLDELYVGHFGII